MILSRVNIILVLLLAVLMLAIVAVEVDTSRPNVEFMPEMKYSPAWEAFEANPNFANGRTLQAPVEGTVARGEVPLHYLATEKDAIRAGNELPNPYKMKINTAQQPTEEDGALSAEDAVKKKAQREQEARQNFHASIKRGGESFRIYCISCHGPQGAGDGPIPKRGFPPPPSLLSGKSVDMKDGQLFHLLTYGQGSMAPFAAQLTPARRWDLINFVRSLQKKAPQQGSSDSASSEAKDENPKREP